MNDSGLQKNGNGTIRFLFENSIFLIAGAVVALVWANIDHHTYHDFVHIPLIGEHASDTEEGHATETVESSGHHGIDLHFLVNDLLMAFFFAIAMKEVFESLLPGGALHGRKKWPLPALATVGGMAGPAGMYLLLVGSLGMWDDFSRGWAVPCATDIAFSYMVAKIIFKNPKHVAIAFLLTLAILDDAGGLGILAVGYPQKPLEPIWFLLTATSMITALVFHKVLKLHSFWWYICIPGAMCWYSFNEAGIHAALGLCPIIPFLPHAKTDIGIFAMEERNRHDTLSEFEHWWKRPVELFLGLFGLMNAGVVMSSVGTGTWVVLASLLIGKPLGIVGMTLLGEKCFGLKLPDGMTHRHLIIVGVIAGLGFTVALFVAAAAFIEPGSIQDQVKMGALLSFGAAPLALLVAKLLRMKP
ncbi:MAG: Na+/H+ antiporter NhaA [Candidatus Peribacteraceae bacterium]|jgi:NhaA family Na+:H+ antiporter|nr:Na+/H+ antiporter NhaA [Candidatus Peribacteraceae bacterium]|tara:strand:- start:398 stop:1639 length:1242 start_codon:yes stop_codon:yes gene_type:complete